MSKKGRPFIPCEGDSTGGSSNHGNEVHVVPIGQDPGTGGSYGNFGPPQPVIDITCLQPVPPAPNRASQIADSGIPRVVFFFFVRCSETEFLQPREGQRGALADSWFFPSFQNLASLFHSIHNGTCGGIIHVYDLNSSACLY